jgi:hypothetical protein
MANDKAKYRAACLCYGVSLFLVIVAIPWWRPFLPHVG